MHEKVPCPRQRTAALDRIGENRPFTSTQVAKIARRLAQALAAARESMLKRTGWNLCHLYNKHQCKSRHGSNCLQTLLATARGLNQPQPLAFVPVVSREDLDSDSAFAARTRSPNTRPAKHPCSPKGSGVTTGNNPVTEGRRSPSSTKKCGALPPYSESFIDDTFVCRQRRLRRSSCG